MACGAVQFGVEAVLGSGWRRCFIPVNPAPSPPPAVGTQSSGDGWSECARGKLAVKAVKGDALLFYDVEPNGKVDPLSTHGSCPTLAGEKWVATRWIHSRKVGDGATAM